LRFNLQVGMEAGCRVLAHPHVERRRLDRPLPSLRAPELQLDAMTTRERLEQDGSATTITLADTL